MSKAEKVLSMTKSEARIGTLKKGDLGNVLDELESYAQAHLTFDQTKKAIGLVRELRGLLL